MNTLDWRSCMCGMTPQVHIFLYSDARKGEPGTGETVSLWTILAVPVADWVASHMTGSLVVLIGGVLLAILGIVIWVRASKKKPPRWIRSARLPGPIARLPACAA